MPLVQTGAVEQPAITDAHGRARRIKAQYTRGELHRVAGGRNQPEAEMIQGMLLEEGIPSILRRTRGFDVPDFLAAGPRDVMVPESGYAAAHDLLSEAELVSQADSPRYPGAGSPLRLFGGVVLAAALAGLVVWVLYQVSF